MTVANFIDHVLIPTHVSWRPLLQRALNAMDVDYLQHLQQGHWLPGHAQLLNAFSLSLTETRFILYGESPYPRSQSANGYAFWDNAVEALWSTTGFSTAVNRATSLRNLLKTLLVAENALTVTDTSAMAIAALDKTRYCQSLRQLFTRFIDHGFLLLNASLVLSHRAKLEEARYWHVFHRHLLQALSQQPNPPKLLLFGKIAEQLQRLTDLSAFSLLQAEHPYNLSFIRNPEVLAFFSQFNLITI